MGSEPSSPWERSFTLELSPDGAAVEGSVPELSPNLVLHSVWGDETGTLHAVGGDLLQYPGPMSGVVLRRR